MEQEGSSPDSEDSTPSCPPSHFRDLLHASPVSGKIKAMALLCGSGATHKAWLESGSWVRVREMGACALAVAKQSDFPLQISTGGLRRVWEERRKRGREVRGKAVTWPRGRLTL